MDIFSISVVAVVALLGLFVGSFLNVVIYRVPRECLSVVKQTRSRCPACSYQFSWYDNVPLVSFLLLRGRCRACGARISWRYPLIELLTGLAFVGLLFHDLGAEGLADPLGAGTRWAVWGVHAVVVAALIALSVIDMDFRILPDVITLPGIVIAPLMVFFVPAVMPGPSWQPLGPGTEGWTPNLNALINGVVWGPAAAGLLWGIGWGGSKIFRKPAMGLGDVKLYAGMGGLVGAFALLALMIASFLGSIIGLVVVLVRKDRYVPFGPFLAAGLVVVLLYGTELWRKLLDFMLP